MHSYLLVVSPAAGFVNVGGALAICIIAAIICYAALTWRIKKGLDDSLDAWAIHGIGGFAGAIPTAIFAVTITDVRGRGEQRGICLQYRAGKMQIHTLP